MRNLQRAIVVAFFALWLVIGAQTVIKVRNTWRGVNAMFDPAPCAGTVLWTDGKPVP